MCSFRHSVLPPESDRSHCVRRRERGTQTNRCARPDMTRHHPVHNEASIRGGAGFDADGGPAYGGSMSDGSNYLDPNRPDAVRLSIAEARTLGEGALARIGYDEDDSRIVTDQLIDNSLCGYRFAGLPRILAIAREAKSKNV